MRAGGYVGGLLLGLVSAPFLVRYLGNVDFGRYTLVLSIIALVQGLTEGGLTGIGLREYTLRRGHEREHLMRNLLGVRVVLTLVGIAVAVAFTVVADYDRTIVLGTAIAGAGLFVAVIQNLIAIPLGVELRFGWATVTELVRQVVAVALTLALIIAGAQLLSFWAVTLAGAVAALIMTVTLVRGAMPIRPALNLAEWQTLTLGMLPYAAATALNVAYFRIAIILMSLLSTATETGYFSVSFRIMEILLPVPGLLVAAVFPIVARAARDDAQRLAFVSGRMYETAVLAGTWLVICVELGAPFAIKFLAGPAGEPSVAVLRLQAVALLATFIAVACGFVLLSLHRHRDLMLANLVALLISAGLLVALVDPLGAKGAAIATASAECVLALVSTLFMTRARPELRPPLGAIGTAALAGAPAVAIAFVPGLHPVLAVAAATVVYFGILAALGRIPSELIDSVPSLGRARDR
jgi:O-antigen/teichoic acid export membrane protein